MLVVQEGARNDEGGGGEDLCWHCCPGQCQRHHQKHHHHYDDAKVRREYREVKLLGDMAGGKVKEGAEK